MKTRFQSPGRSRLLSVGLGAEPGGLCLLEASFPRERQDRRVVCLRRNSCILDSVPFSSTLKAVLFLVLELAALLDAGYKRTILH